MSAISYKPVTYFNIKFENNEHGIFRPGETMYGKYFKNRNFVNYDGGKLHFRNCRTLC